MANSFLPIKQKTVIWVPGCLILKKASRYYHKTHTMHEQKFSVAAIFFFILILSSEVYGLTVDVRTYGAKPDGKTLNTIFIQNAIDQVASERGGVVMISRCFAQ